MQRMRFALVPYLFFVAMTLPPTIGFARDSSIRTEDLVVWGRVKSLDYEALDEFGFNGQITARLTITRVVRGRPPSSVLTIKYIAHTNYVEDRAFRFHLRRSKDGAWLACSDGGGRGYVCR